MVVNPSVATKEQLTVLCSMPGLAEDAVPLTMVAIPSGEFQMGSPDNEVGNYGDELPQHRVSVKPFLISQYPVTQAQWRCVAKNLPQVQIQLPPDPSSFKGDNLPVERVNWYEAAEFCARLTQATGRAYRLPTEAEWEYACRAGTTTPFHFGETISPKLANYCTTEAFADDSTGEYRGKTTPVGHFAGTNAFGLSDMHGNVWEWCEDHWHDNYEGAPTDGSAWLSEDKAFDRVLRGGSWFYLPRFCRSAGRDGYDPDYRNFNIGFRVACSSAKTL